MSQRCNTFVTMRAFGFYGRVSTEDQQDPESSLEWQRSRANGLIGAVGGEIVAGFFDVGESRSLPWKRRPEAMRLLQALPDADRGFDAVYTLSYRRFPICRKECTSWPTSATRTAS